MGIYIQSMEIPQNCFECHFGHGETGICVVDFKSHGDWNEPHDCPLVPLSPHYNLIDKHNLKHKEITIDYDEGVEFPAISIPPHGRLIDADDVNNHILGYVDLRDCPTIIPAEEGEEE